MSKYIVEKKDLKGKIKNFPIEVVQKMVDYQVLQGNKADVSVFQHDATANHFDGGFDWDETKEGVNFWDMIISDNLFDVFCQYFPDDVVYTFMLADKPKHNANIIKHLEQYCRRPNRYYYLAPYHNTYPNN